MEPEERGGDSRQVRNSTGPPGMGGKCERVYPWDWRNTEISTPGERKRIETKIAQVAQRQAHAQVTGDAPPGPLPSWNT